MPIFSGGTSPNSCLGISFTLIQINTIVLVSNFEGKYEHNPNPQYISLFLCDLRWQNVWVRARARTLALAERRHEQGEGMEAFFSELYTKIIFTHFTFMPAPYNDSNNNWIVFFSVDFLLKTSSTYCAYVFFRVLVDWRNKRTNTHSKKKHQIQTLVYSNFLCLCFLSFFFLLACLLTCLCVLAHLSFRSYYLVYNSYVIHTYV